MVKHIDLGHDFERLRDDFDALSQVQQQKFFTVQSVFDRALDEIADAEEALVRQFINGYASDSGSPIADLLKHSREKNYGWGLALGMQMLIEDGANFPQNLLDAYDPDMVTKRKPYDIDEAEAEDIVDYDRKGIAEEGYILPEGVAKLKRQYSEMVFRTFRRNLDKHVHGGPSFSSVEPP